MCSGKNFLPGVQMATFSLCPHMASLRCIQGEIFGVSSCKGTTPSRSGPCSMTPCNLHFFLRGPISKCSHSGVTTPTSECWGDTNIQSIRYYKVILIFADIQNPTNIPQVTFSSKCAAYTSVGHRLGCWQLNRVSPNVSSLVSRS